MASDVPSFDLFVQDCVRRTAQLLFPIGVGHEGSWGVAL